MRKYQEYKLVKELEEAKGPHTPRPESAPGARAQDYKGQYEHAVPQALPL